MYRAVFIFDMRELQRRFEEMVFGCRKRTPELAELSTEDLLWIWCRLHLREFHHVICIHDDREEYLSQVDWDFEHGPADGFFERAMYRMFAPALQPATHPCFYYPASLRIHRTTIYLTYEVRDGVVLSEYRPKRHPP